MNSPTENSSPAAPRVVLIISNGAPLIGDPAVLGGRPCRHGILRMPHLPLAALAMTAATGVDPLVHDIVTSTVVHPADLTTGPATHADRRFPAFWTDAARSGLRTLAIDWPASEDDPDLPDAITPTTVNTRVGEAEAVDSDRLAACVPPDASAELQDAARHFLTRLDVTFAAAAEAINSESPPDLLAMVLRDSNTPVPDAAMSSAMNEKLDALVSHLPADTPVLIVRRWVDENGNATRAMPYAFTLVGGPQTEAPDTLPGLSLSAVGGGTRRLAGLPCPHGVAVPQWKFVTWADADSNRPLPQGVRESDTDWDSLVDRVQAMPETPAKKKAARCLTYRFATLASIAVTRQRWSELKPLARWLVSLRGDVVDHWLAVYAANRLGDSDAVPTLISAMASAHPNNDVTTIARCIVLATRDPDTTRAMLDPIDAATLPAATALGTLGRLSLLVGLHEPGADAIQRAIQRGVACEADRGILAAHLLRQGQPEHARQALGRLGGPNGAKHWCILRLRILLALDHKDAAAQLAESILDRFPAEPTVVQLMQTI
ncbi:MAG: hypothetical protein QGG74_04325 [Phycisphaerales bacterium]|nr:hypothetical protein [Phycisphaerales bacterium]